MSSQRRGCCGKELRVRGEGTRCGQSGLFWCVLGCSEDSGYRGVALQEGCSVSAMATMMMREIDQRSGNRIQDQREEMRVSIIKWE